MSSDLSDDSVTASDEELEHAAGHPGAQTNGEGPRGAAVNGSAPAVGAAAAEAAAKPLTAAAAADREAEAALLAGELTQDAALLQLQVNELLAEVRPASIKSTSWLGYIQQLRSALGAIKPREVPGTLLSGFIRDLGLNPDEVSLPFEPPAAVEAIGSFPLHCCLSGSSPPAVLDVAVNMPASCLHKKDNLNYKYHARRALYLAVLSKALAKTPAFSQQRLDALQGDPTRPALLLHLPAPAPTLRLLVVPPRDLFPVHKLAPDRNNIRWVTRQQPAAHKGQAAAAAAAPAQLPLLVPAGRPLPPCSSSPSAPRPQGRKTPLLDRRSDRRLASPLGAPLERTPTLLPKRPAPLVQQ